MTIIFVLIGLLVIVSKVSNACLRGISSVLTISNEGAYLTFKSIFHKVLKYGIIAFCYLPCACLVFVYLSRQANIVLNSEGVFSIRVPIKTS